MLSKNKSLRKDESGFTLVEVMIAIVVFCFGLLAIASMQTGAVDTNAIAFDITEATHLAETKMEELMSLPMGDLNVLDTDGDGDATVEDSDSDGIDEDDDDGNPDDNDGDFDLGNFGLDDTGVDPVAGGPLGADGILVGPNGYIIQWNIADNVLGTDTKIIKVIVTWNSIKGPKQVDITSVKTPM